jgi:hypothetical protein
VILNFLLYVLASGFRADQYILNWFQKKMIPLIEDFSALSKDLFSHKFGLFFGELDIEVRHAKGNVFEKVFGLFLMFSVCFDHRF